MDDSPVPSKRSGEGSDCSDDARDLDIARERDEGALPSFVGCVEDGTFDATNDESWLAEQWKLEIS